MKKLIRTTASLKIASSFVFAALVMLAALISAIRGVESLPITFVFQAALISLVFGALYSAVMSEKNVYKAKKHTRVIVLGTSTLVAFALFAAVFRWFDVLNVYEWVIFIGLYIASFLISAFAMHLAFRLSGLKLNQALEAFKVNQEND